MQIYNDTKCDYLQFLGDQETKKKKKDRFR